MYLFNGRSPVQDLDRTQIIFFFSFVRVFMIFFVLSKIYLYTETTIQKFGVGKIFFN